MKMKTISSTEFYDLKYKYAGKIALAVSSTKHKVFDLFICTTDTDFNLVVKDTYDDYPSVSFQRDNTHVLVTEHDCKDLDTYELDIGKTALNIDCERELIIDDLLAMIPCAKDILDYKIESSHEPAEHLVKGFERTNIQIEIHGMVFISTKQSKEWSLQGIDNYPELEEFIKEHELPFTEPEAFWEYYKALLDELMGWG